MMNTIPAVQRANIDVTMGPEIGTYVVCTNNVPSKCIATGIYENGTNTYKESSDDLIQWCIENGSKMILILNQIRI